jgi:hypothetical protein
MTKCPNCGKECKSNKSWSYGVFQVYSFSCECGLRFNEYESISILIDDTKRKKAESIQNHHFILLRKNGKWAKA